MDDDAPQASDTPITATRPIRGSSSSSAVPAPPISVPPPPSRPAPNSSSSSLRTVYIKNLSPTVDSVFLKITCSPYGDVSNVKVIREADGVSKGFAFVTFKQAEQAKRAISMLNGKELDGRILFAGPAIKRASRHNQQQQHNQSSQRDSKFIKSGYLETAQSTSEFLTQPNHSSHLNLKLGIFSSATSPKRKRRAFSEPMDGDKDCELVSKCNISTKPIEFESNPVTVHHQQKSPLSPTRNFVAEKNCPSNVRDRVKKLPRSLSSLVFSCVQAAALPNLRAKQNLRHVDGSPCAAAHRRLVAPYNDTASTKNAMPRTSGDIQSIDDIAWPSMTRSLKFSTPTIASSQTHSTDARNLFCLPPIQQRQSHLHQSQFHPQQSQIGKLCQYTEISDARRQNAKIPCCASQVHPNIGFPHPRYGVLPQINTECPNCLPQRTFNPQDSQQQNNRKRRRAHSLQRLPYRNGQIMEYSHCAAGENTSIEERTVNAHQQTLPNDDLRGKKDPMIFGEEISGDQTVEYSNDKDFWEAGWDNEQTDGRNFKICRPKVYQKPPQEIYTSNLQDVPPELVRRCLFPFSEKRYDAILNPYEVVFHAEHGENIEDQQETLREFTENERAQFEQQLQQQRNIFNHQEATTNSHPWHESVREDYKTYRQEKILRNKTEISDTTLTTPMSLQYSTGLSFARQNLDSAINLPILNTSRPLEDNYYPHSLQSFNISRRESSHVVPCAHSVHPIPNYTNKPYHEDTTCIKILNEKQQSSMPAGISDPSLTNKEPATYFVQPGSSVVEGASHPEKIIETPFSAANDICDKSMSQAESLGLNAEDQGYTVCDHSICSACDDRNGDQTCPVCHETCEDTAQTGSILQQGINLYVKHLSEDIDDDGLKEMFSKFGEVLSAKVMMEGERSRGFGFVCFSRAEDAARATRDMRKNIDDVNKYNLYVAPAQRKEERQAFFREKLKAKRRDLGKKGPGSKDGAKIESKNFLCSAHNNTIFGKPQDSLNPIFPQNSSNFFKFLENVGVKNKDEKLGNDVLSGEEHKTALDRIAQGKRKIQTLFSKGKKLNLSHFDCFNVERLRTPLIKPSKLIHGSASDSFASGKTKESPTDFVCGYSVNSIEPRDFTSIPQTKSGDSGSGLRSSALEDKENEIPQWGSPHDESKDWPNFPSNPTTTGEHEGNIALQKLTPIGCRLANPSLTHGQVTNACVTDPLVCARLMDEELSVTAQASITNANLQRTLASSCACLAFNNSPLSPPLSTPREPHDIYNENSVAVSDLHHVNSDKDTSLPPIVEAVCNIFSSSSSEEQEGTFSLSDALSDIREAPSRTVCRREPATQGINLSSDILSSSTVSQDGRKSSASRLDLKRSRKSIKREQDVFNKSIQKHLNTITGETEDDCPRRPKRRLLEVNALSDFERPDSAMISSNSSRLEVEEMLTWPVETQKASLSWKVCMGIRDVLETLKSQAKESHEIRSSTLIRLLEHGWTVEALLNSLVAMAMELDVVEILNLLQAQDCLEIMVNQGLAQLWNGANVAGGSISIFEAEADTHENIVS